MVDGINASRKEIINLNDESIVVDKMEKILRSR